MKLLCSLTSPYARKVRIVILEKGLSARVALQTASPMSDDSSIIRNANPLGKIPVLVRDAQPALYDSPVICEYLDSLASSPVLFPAEGEARWSALRRQALGDGMMDAAFNLVMESRRPAAMRAPDWTARWETAIAHGAAAAQEDVARAQNDFDIGAVALSCALGYLDFRLGRLGWRDRNPGLAKWFETIKTRASVAETTPPVDG